MILKLISHELGIGPGYIKKVIDSASHRYKTYTVPKRGDTKKLRTIHHPSRELKLIQRWIAQNIFAAFPVHDRVYSYRKGTGIADIANLHKNQSYLLRVDFKNFFPSIFGEDIIELLKKNEQFLPPSFLPADYERVISAVCRKNQLTIGAPSSPIISNSILFDFDNIMHAYCIEMDIQYSRYADDLFLSSNKKEVLRPAFEFIRIQLEEMNHPKLIVNERKTLNLSKKHRRMVTGLVLTSDKNISIGRDKKRELKALVHQYQNGVISPDRFNYLKGYLSFVNSVEPTFINSLIKKYGEEVIDRIKCE